MKKILAVLLVAAMVFCFAACTAKTPATDDTTTPATEGTTTPAADDGAEETSADAGTLVIGGIGPITGGAAVYGQSVKNGANLAVDEINAAGGINGMQIKFLFQDDEHNPEKAVSAYNTLVDQGMQALIGTVTSGPCTAVAAETVEDNMFQITPSGSAVDCVKFDNAFRICFSDPNQGAASAQYISDNGLASKVAVIYDSSDIYSSGIYETFVMRANELGLEIVDTEAFTSDSKTDFTVQINKIKESGAELVFLPFYYQEAALVLTQAQGVLEDVKYFGCDGLDGLIDQLGENVDLAEGVMLLTPFAADAEDELTQHFTSSYMDEFGGVPTQFAADAYDAVYTIKKAIEYAGISDASISASDLCDALVAAMTEIEVEGVTGTMTWDASGEPTKDPKAMEIVVTDGVGSYKAI